MRPPFALGFVAGYCLVFAACSRANDQSLIVDVPEAIASAEALAVVRLSLEPSDIGTLAYTFALGKSERTGIYFYDTPELSLFDRGILLQARQRAVGADEISVTIRSLTSTRPGKHFENLIDFACGDDVTQDARTPWCGLSDRAHSSALGAVLRGDASSEALFSKDQKSFVARYAEDVPWDALEVIGPIDSNVWSVDVPDFEQSLALEQWTLPNGAALLEISARTTRGNADVTLEELRTFLRERGIEPRAHEGQRRGAISHLAENE